MPCQQFCHARGGEARAAAPLPSATTVSALSVTASMTASVITSMITSTIARITSKPPRRQWKGYGPPRGPANPLLLLYHSAQPGNRRDEPGSRSERETAEQNRRTRLMELAVSSLACSAPCNTDANHSSKSNIVAHDERIAPSASRLRASRCLQPIRSTARRTRRSWSRQGADSQPTRQLTRERERETNQTKQATRQPGNLAASSTSLSICRLHGREIQTSHLCSLASPRSRSQRRRCRGEESVTDVESNMKLLHTIALFALNLPSSASSLLHNTQWRRSKS